MAFGYYALNKSTLYLLSYFTRGNIMCRGLKPVEKRSGAGAHNWGSITDAVQ